MRGGAGESGAARRRARGIGWAGLALTALATCAAFALGLLQFASALPMTEAETSPEADGMVVLTGAPDRIADAAALLSAGRSRRLLISGVRVGVTAETLTHQLPRFRALFECCVDLGHAALNTAGNAQEASAWARERGYASLVVVTSSWHMPRTLVEFRAAMPGVRLLPYAVVSDRFAAGGWLRDGQVARTLAMEYAKFLVAWARIRLGALTA